MSLSDFNWGKGLFRLWLVLSLVWMIGLGSLSLPETVKEYYACKEREKYMKSLLTGKSVKELYEIIYPPHMQKKEQKTEEGVNFKPFTSDEVEELYKNNVEEFMRGYKDVEGAQRKIFIKLDGFGHFSSMNDYSQNKNMASYNYGCDSKKRDIYLYIGLTTIPVIIVFILGAALLWAFRGFLPKKTT